MRDPHYEERFFELLRLAEDAKYAPESGPWLEEAYRLADQQGDVEHGLLARYFYIFAVAPLQPEHAIVAFAWVTAHEQHATGTIPATWLVQLYGLIGGILRSYPQYSLAQIAATFERMTQRYQELGLPLRDVYHHRIYEALGTGARDAGSRWFELWQLADRPRSACEVCDLGTHVIYELFQESYDAGFRYAQPIWDGLRCQEGQPLMAASACLIPLLRNREWAQAERCYRISVAELQTISYAGIWAAGRQLGYLAAAGEVVDVVRNFDRYFTTAWTSGTPADRFGYLLSAYLVGLRLQEEDTSVSLRIPNSCELYREDATYDGAAVTKFFKAQCEDLVQKFDERNGNTEFERIVGLTLEVFDDTRRRRP